MSERKFGQVPVVDHQGNKPVCVSSAMSKAITAGLEYARWTQDKFDVGQDFVFGLLIAENKKLVECNPKKLNGTMLNLKNKIDNTWAEFTLLVKQMTKAEFLSNRMDKTLEFMVGQEQHCYYVEEIEEDGRRLKCMDSAGESDPDNPARPDIYTQTLNDNDIWSVELLDEEDLKVVATITSDTELKYPSLAKVEQLARLARAGKLSPFKNLHLRSIDLRTVADTALVSLLSLPRLLSVFSGTELSDAQLALLGRASEGEGWRVQMLNILSECGPEESKAWGRVCRMTNRVSIQIDFIVLDWDQFFAGFRGTEGEKGRCVKIAFYSRIGQQKYRVEIGQLRTRLGWNMREDGKDIIYLEPGKVQGNGAGAQAEFGKPGLDSFENLTLN